MDAVNADKRIAARWLLKYQVLSRSGQAFEDFLVKILRAAYASFTPVKPQGQLGDRKNDGFDRTTGTYFQVYAPENPSSSDTVAKAIEKAEADFDGLYNYWNSICPIKAFRFAYNDKYYGTQPSLELTLANIKVKYQLEDARVFLAKDLEDAFLTLSYEDMVDIVGFLPDPDSFPPFEVQSLNEILEYILRKPHAPACTGTLSAPDFDKKLVFNALGEHIQHLLWTGSYHAGTIEDYFAANSAFERQNVRDIINNKYRHYAESGASADTVFHHLLADLIPKPPQLAHASAAHVLLAYYFESCDIFEAPDHSPEEDKGPQPSADAEVTQASPQEAG